MDIQTFQQVAASNTWGALLPEIALLVLGFVLLIAELGPFGRNVNALFRIAISGQMAILVWVMIANPAGGLSEGLFGGLMTFGPLYDVTRVFFLLSGIFVTLLARGFLLSREVPKGEYFAIVCFLTASLMVLSGASHFLLLFVALETVTIGFYVLVAYSRTEVFSLEAGIKYIVLGGLSTAILLMGIALLYGASGMPGLEGRTTEGMDFEALGQFIAFNSDHPLVLVGAVLVVAGICFKIGAVPFQIWIPDVYQGAPLPTTAFLAVASKSVGFFVLIALVTGPFAALDGLLVPILSGIAVVTILFGNLAALTQRSVKRLVGLSGVAHAGYLLLGVTAAFSVDWAASAVLLYLFIYLFASFGVFGVVNAIQVPSEEQSIDGYSELAVRNPFLGTVLVISLASLAGIPPLAGFIGKFFLFVSAFEAGLFIPLGVALVGVVLSIYYYFGWIREVAFKVWHAPGDEPRADRENPELVRMSYRVALGVLVTATVFFGIFQKPLTALVGL